jgi:pimeloyl-ACP methyl ester carboxylesterase
MRIRLIGLSLTAVLSCAAVGHAEDFGKWLEKAGKDLLKKQLSPENIDRTLKPHEMNAQAYAVKTGDGWTLVAHRYRPAGKPNGQNPVILCHGLSYNAMFWDLDPACSFAEYLAKEGYDVWSVNLRGCGLSQKWVWKADAAPTMIAGGLIRKLTDGKLAPTGYATVDPQFADWTLDDHITYDVAALVHLVRHHTKTEEVTWVGHSMGGIVAICHLARYKNPGIGKLVVVGSQVTMPNGQLMSQFCVEMIKTREKQLDKKLDKKELARETEESIHNMFFNEKNVDKKVYEALRTWANDVPSVGLLKQYAVLSKKGELLDAQGDFNYARNLKNVTVPMFISGGEADQLAPPQVQKFLYDEVGAKAKTLVIFGRTHGFKVNAGHNDALVGLNSQKEVYPVIEKWIRTGKH